MYVDDKFQIAMTIEGNEPVYMYPKMCNRHGLITGATGTGKTVTLKTIAQSLSDAGVPTFLADVKGDVSGMAISGEGNEGLVEHLAGIGITDYDFHACPVRFWDIYDEGGMPVRTTISEMGPVLLGRLLGLSEVQEGVLNIIFHVADDEGMLLLDIKDLRSLLVYVAEHADEYKVTYGNVSDASVGAIQRALLQLEDAGGDLFFGEPALDIQDWIACDADGKGYVNLLDARRLMHSPLLYSTFLLWMLSELYESLPEVGDLDKPKIVFFFDEAHTLFNDAPKALLEKINQVVKLVRSKGVGVFFITQNPADIPDTVLAQLGNRVQHALRAYTPAELKAVKAAAESFRANPDFDTEKAIQELGTGEALVSFLDEKGTPQVVQRTNVIAPSCSMDAADEVDRDNIINACPLLSKYSAAVDRVSAYEMLVASATGAPITPEVHEAAQTAAAEPAYTTPATYSETAYGETADAAYTQATAPAPEAAPAPAPAPATASPIAQAAAAAHAVDAASTPTEKELAAQLKEAERARKEAEKEAERARKEAEKAALKAEKEAQKAAEKAAREEQKRQEKLEREAQRAYEKRLKEEERLRRQQEKDAQWRQRRIESIGVSIARTAATTLTRTFLGGLKRR